jgi:hypothetical protein
MIHPTHSRKDLIEVIETFELWDIGDYKDMSKTKIAKELWSYLKKYKKDVSDDALDISNIDDLRKYLINHSLRQIVSEKDKIIILDKVRNIMFYAKHTGYFLSGSNYKNLKEIEEDARYLSKYGDLTSVRRALLYYNNDISNPVKIEPVITHKTQKRLERVAEIKRMTKPSFKLNKGEFLIEFL